MSNLNIISIPLGIIGIAAGLNRDTDGASIFACLFAACFILDAAIKDLKDK